MSQGGQLKIAVAFENCDLQCVVVKRIGINDCKEVKISLASF